MDQSDPFNHTECFDDILDYHQWVRRGQGETTESRDADAFVAQQADSIKARYIEAVANAANDCAGDAIEDDSDGGDDAESEYVAI